MANAVLFLGENCVILRLTMLFQHPERDFVLKFSALEIYNESVRDLLSVDSTPLRLLDDPEVNIPFSGSAFFDNLFNIS